MNKILNPTRRNFITGVVSLLMAPAIVRVENIMPVKVYNNNDLEKFLTRLSFNSSYGKFHAYGPHGFITFVNTPNGLRIARYYDGKIVNLNE